MPGPLTWWHTVRYLRAEQVYRRLWFHVARPKPDLRPAPARRPLSGSWTAPSLRAPSMLDATRFRFLGVTLDLRDVGWDDPRVDRLWRYNLHYFDDLVARDACDRASWHHDLLRQWVQENRPGVGTAWEPYPTSLRIVNWIKWSLAGGLLPAEAIQSLAVQTRWLERRLERHLLGNHLFANAKALLFAGSYFAGGEADRWRSLGLDILERELDEQILPDGGHFELSTMYHALALEDVLDLCNAAAALPAEPRLVSAARTWRERAQRMQFWLAAMCHPDGRIGFFNDAAFDIAPEPPELQAYGARLGAPAPDAPDGSTALTTLPASGYVRLQLGPAVALLDVARIGPDYLPAHAHADTLTFELSAFGQRVLVNSGTSQYGIGAERLRERGTAAHNTVVVNGENSSEVWGGFRVGRRARPGALHTREAGAVTVQCSHDGYRRLPGRPQHTRTWVMDERMLRVEDVLIGGVRKAASHWHVHPEVRLSAPRATPDGTQVDLTLRTGQRLLMVFRDAELTVESCAWHPRFGESVAATCLVATFRGSGAVAEIRWSPA